MASSAKKRAIGSGENPEESENSPDENLGDDDSSGEEDSDASDEEINEEVVVDFEAHTISGNDFNGIKKLLQQLFLKAHVNTSELTDLIIQQNHIGSVVKQAEVPEDSDNDDDPDEVFGFITMLNLTERKGVQCVEEVKELIIDQCEKNCPHSTTEQLEQILNDTSKPVGLLLSERFINVPPQIALPLHKQLQCNPTGTKCTWHQLKMKYNNIVQTVTDSVICLVETSAIADLHAVNNADNEEDGLPPQHNLPQLQLKRRNSKEFVEENLPASREEMAEAQRTNKPSGRCHYCLMISKTCKEATKSISARGGTPKDEVMFVNAEEEFFDEQATMKFHYSVQEEADSCLSGRWSFDDVPMKPFRTVMLIPADRMPAIMDKLKEYLTI